MMKVFSLYSSILMFFISSFAIAQVGIGTITPDPASVLDVTATDKGILIPRVSLDAISNTMIDGVNAVSEGMLLYNTNTAIVGGAGVGFYFFNGAVWEKLNGATPGGSDADWFVENTTNAPTSIDDDIYTNGNVAIGDSDALYPLSLNTVTSTRALNINVDTPGDDTMYGGLITMNNDGDGNQYGIRLNNTKGGDGEQYGVYTSLSGNTNSRKYGLYNNVSGNGDDLHFGVVNSLSGNGDERKFAIYNILSVNGAGRVWGMNNTFTGNKTGTNYGVQNDFFTSVDATFYGFHNNFFGASPGTQFGLNNSFINDGSGDRFGVNTSMNGEGDGRYYANFSNIGNNGNGNHYGSYTTMSGIGTGPKYGSYIHIQDSNSSGTTGGDLYGIYSNVERLTGVSYAAYFLGNVSIGTTAANSYILPASDGTAGQVMQTDGAGQLSWVTPTAPRSMVSSEVEINNTTLNQVEELTSEIENLKQIIAQQQEQLTLLLETVNTSSK